MNIDKVFVYFLPSCCELCITFSTPEYYPTKRLGVTLKYKTKVKDKKKYIKNKKDVPAYAKLDVISNHAMFSRSSLRIGCQRPSTMVTWLIQFAPLSTSASNPYLQWQALSIPWASSGSPRAMWLTARSLTSLPRKPLDRSWTGQHGQPSLGKTVLLFPKAWSFQ